MNTKVMFSTGNNNWSTPQSFFDRLNSVFHFTLDPCADDTNHKCDLYYTQQDDGLAKNWGGKQFFVILHTLVRRKAKVVRKIGLKNAVVKVEKTGLLP